MQMNASSYIPYGKKELSIFPKSELNDLGMQCHYNSESHPYHNTSLCNWAHIILLFENGFWYLQRGAGSHWTFNVLLLKLYSFHPVLLWTNCMVAAGLLLPNSQVTKRKESNCLHACTQTIWHHLHTSHSTSTHPIILTTVNPTQAPQ
jgi:hypothetical protein